MPTTPFDLKFERTTGLAFSRSRSEGNSKAVLFIHGLGNTHRFWRFAQEALEPRYDCIAIDLPGFGESQAPASGLSLESTAAQIRVACQRFGLAEVDVVAHSLGSYVALQLARDSPELFQRVLLVSGTLESARLFLSGEGFNDSSRKTQASLVGQFLGALMPLRRRTSTLLQRSSSLRAATLWPFVAKPREFLGAPLDLALHDGGGRSELLEIVRQAGQLDLADFLGGISVPVSQIRGEEDRLVVPDDVEVYRSLLQNFQHDLVMESVGHWPMLEAPDRFNTHLASWLTHEFN